MTYLLYGFSGVGVLALVLLCLGIWLDFSDFDRTRGGYEPAFEGVTGEPVDWVALDRTPTGLAKRGYVVNTLANGTSGMISFEVFGLEVPFRQLSERALAVHRPREAFIQLGFKPEF